MNGYRLGSAEQPAATSPPARRRRRPPSTRKVREVACSSNKSVVVILRWAAYTARIFRANRTRIPPRRAILIRPLILTRVLDIYYPCTTHNNSRILISLYEWRSRLRHQEPPKLRLKASSTPKSVISSHAKLTVIPNYRLTSSRTLFTFQSTRHSPGKLDKA